MQVTPHPPYGHPLPYLFSVAQIVNLPYRRLQIGRALAVFRRPGQGAVLQDGILRYSAARRSRNQSSADWESAVSRIGNPQTFADCQSAKQQIDNLRYEKSSRGATISADTDRLAEDEGDLLAARPRGEIIGLQ